MWEDFTNAYSLSKTLRFELVPTDATQEQLNSSVAIETDQIRHENFRQAKKILDEIHRKFIADSLSNLNLDSSQLQAYADLSLNKSPKTSRVKLTELEKLRKSLYNTFGKAFVDTENIWGERYGYQKFKTSPESQLALIEVFKGDLAQKLKMSEINLTNIIETFAGFTSYFQGYKENRANIYSVKGHATEIAHRSIDQNLLKFYKNIQKFEGFYAGTDILDQPTVEYFKIENYSNYIAQDEIDGYNDAINLFRSTISQLRQGLSKRDKKAFPMFEPLFKQILGDGTNKVLFEKLENDQEYNKLVTQLQEELPRYVSAIDAHAKMYVQNPVNCEAIWLNSKAVNTLIYKNIFNSELVKDYLPKEFTSQKKSKDDESAKQYSFVSLQQLFTAIDQAQEEAEQSILKADNSATVVVSRVVWENFFEDIQSKMKVAKPAIEAFLKLENFNNTVEKETLKKALDSFNDIYRMYSYFELRYKNEPVTSLVIDPDFYQLFESLEGGDSLFDIDKDRRFSHYYDLIRNYLTKKPYSLDKWKLNFNCSQLLTGWDINKESEKRGVIITNGDDYYLAIINHDNKKVFDHSKNPKLFAVSSGSWKKMEYKLLPGPNKMLPKCLLPKSDRHKYGATDEVLDIYETGSFKQGDNFELSKLHKVIDFYKQAIKRYEGWSMYDFTFKNTDEYGRIDEFYHDVESQGYKLNFVPINGDELHNLAEKGMIYLFHIRNKDLANPNSRTANMHTLYFRELFETGSKIKLSGGAEIFFRPKTNNLSGSNTDRKTPQGTAVTELKRFRSDKIQFHVSINLNYQTKSFVNATFNRHAIERIKTNQVDSIIGIDRGEKHLAYVSVVDKNGKLLDEPMSLNTVSANLPDGREKITPYFDLLDSREKERKENRQNWDAVRQIKDLKSGYIGHCVKRIVDLMIKHNAVVVLENLNIGFKQGRSAIEKSVYNQLEQALLHKLQYVVNKKLPAGELFGAQNGVQLSPPDVTPGSTYSHMGFVFFVDPSYTSAVDPVTGYRQHFRLDERINTRTFSEFIKDGFESIQYKDDNLLFTFNWRKLAVARNKIKRYTRSREKESDISDKVWTITANVNRLIYDKKVNESHGTTITVCPQTKLLELFGEYGIDLSLNIQEQLAALTPDSIFVHSFVRSFNTINKIRNSNTETNIDAIISPVYKTGFDSTRDKIDGYEWNGDANGAYNIARKGAILINKLYHAETPGDFKATVTRKEYDDYITR